MLRTDAGTVVVDTMLMPLQGAKIRELAEKLTGQPVRVVRITSYNVCYTKLLRSVLAAKAIRSVALGIVVTALIQTAIGGTGLRITSYNVCYTKLLRSHEVKRRPLRGQSWQPSV